MKGELLRIVDSIHREKNIDPEIVFRGIESAFLAAAKKYFGDEEEIVVTIDRESGEISATRGNESIDAEILGRIPAQSAKQIMIQKIREAERDALFDEFIQEKGTIHTGVVQRHEGPALTVNIGKVEALLPRGEQIPGESYHPGERVRAVIAEVRKAGQRIKIILSRTHPEFVRKLFEQEIPEIAERIIEIRAIAREAGYRTKIAVSSIDSKVDCVGACVGVRGSRIKNILDELSGERIDIIRYNESLQIMIPNALAPAQIEEVQIYPAIGRAIVLVKEDQLSLAIGKRGQNVRLASKLVGVDIEIMTFDELTEEIDRAEAALATLEGIDEDVVDALIVEGLLSFDDISVMEPEKIMEVTGADREESERIIAMCEEAAEAAPQEQSTRSSILSGPVESEEDGDGDVTVSEAEDAATEDSEAPVEEAGAEQEEQTDGETVQGEESLEATTEESSSSEVTPSGKAAIDEDAGAGVEDSPAKPAAGEETPSEAVEKEEAKQTAHSGLPESADSESEASREEVS